MANSVRVVNPSKLGVAAAPYSQAAIANGFIFLAGQVALDPSGGVVSPGDVKAQTSYVVGRIRTVLTECGATLADVVSTTVFITSYDDFIPFNESWAAEFGDHRPPRATVLVGLLMPGLVVEVQAVAALAHTGG